MVLDPHVAVAARSGDVDFMETWLQSLDRPEAINDVDYKGRTVLHTRENYSNTQLKKRVAVSRCKDCVVRVWPT